MIFDNVWFSDKLPYVARDGSVFESQILYNLKFYSWPTWDIYGYHTDFPYPM